MTDTHVISALRLKRAEISGYIHDLEKRIARHRANLANLDVTLRLFAPGTNPDERVLTVLRRLAKRGTVVKSGTSRNAQWALAR